MANIFNRPVNLGSQPNGPSNGQSANGPPPSPGHIQRLLEDNCQYITEIADLQAKGKLNETVQYQQMLHRNLAYLAMMADNNQNVNSFLLPAPGSGATSSASSTASTSAPSGSNTQTSTSSTSAQPMQHQPPTTNTMHTTSNHGVRPYPAPGQHRQPYPPPPNAQQQGQYGQQQHYGGYGYQQQQRFYQSPAASQQPAPRMTNGYDSSSSSGQPQGPSGPQPPAQQQQYPPQGPPPQPWFLSKRNCIESQRFDLQDLHKSSSGE